MQDEDAGLFCSLPGIIMSGMSWYKSCSFSLASAFFAIVWNACSTLTASLALVSKYGTLFFSWHHCIARLVVTFHKTSINNNYRKRMKWFSLSITVRLSAMSTLLPITTKGKFSGSRGEACIRNSSRQLSKFLNVVAWVTS